jgi:hypothetical protein
VCFAICPFQTTRRLLEPRTSRNEAWEMTIGFCGRGLCCQSENCGDLTKA